MAGTWTFQVSFHARDALQEGRTWWPNKSPNLFLCHQKGPSKAQELRNGCHRQASVTQLGPDFSWVVFARRAAQGDAQELAPHLAQPDLPGSTSL